MRPAEWFEKPSWVVSGRHAARGSAPHRGPHEVASKAAQKPRSTAVRRSEDHAFALRHRPEDLRRAFFFLSILDGAFKPTSHKDSAEWPTGRPAREISLCIRPKPN